MWFYVIIVLIVFIILYLIMYLILIESTCDRSLQTYNLNMFLFITDGDWYI